MASVIPPPPAVPPGIGRSGTRVLMLLVVGLALLGVCGVYLYRRFVPGSATGTTRPPLERPEGGLVKGFAGQILLHTSNQSLTVLLNGLEKGSQPLPDMILQDESFRVQIGGGFWTYPTYLRPNDRGDVLGVPVESIQYIFNVNEGTEKRLWMVVHSVSASNAVPLLTAMKREFGEPDWTDKDGYFHWYEPKGDYKRAVLLVAYSVEKTGEAGVIVISPFHGPYKWRYDSLKKAEDALKAVALAPVSKDSREALESEVATLPGQKEETPPVEVLIGREHNKEISNLIVAKDIQKGELVIAFKTSSMCYDCKLLVRLFDSNGAYLTHRATPELWHIFKENTAPNWEFTIRQLPIRDLRDVKTVEVGYTWKL